jgi:hypothetical protein
MSKKPAYSIQTKCFTDKEDDLYLVIRYCALEMPQPEYSELNFTCLTSNEWLVYSPQSHTAINHMQYAIQCYLFWGLCNMETLKWTPHHPVAARPCAKYPTYHYDVKMAAMVRNKQLTGLAKVLLSGAGLGFVPEWGDLFSVLQNVSPRFPGSTLSWDLPQW